LRAWAWGYKDGRHGLGWKLTEMETGIREMRGEKRRCAW
jgi:hypothetical protein